MPDLKTQVESARTWMLRYLGHGLGQNSKMLEQARAICEMMESEDFDPAKAVIQLSDLVDKCKKFTANAVSIQAHAILWQKMLSFEAGNEE